MVNIWTIALLLTGLSSLPIARQINGHPAGLRVLFFIEMWERFSYYGMRGLLIFYFTEHFLFDDRAAQGRYAAYTTLNYLTPLLGGLIADRWLGARKAVAFGAVLLVIGHVVMAIEGQPARQILTHDGDSFIIEASGRGESRITAVRHQGRSYAFTIGSAGEVRFEAPPPTLPKVIAKTDYSVAVTHRDETSLGLMNLALAFIVMGVGCLKSNITTLVGALYPERDGRRDQGFTLYYYGINLGSFWAAVACGWLGLKIGWWAGFGAAGLGMVAGYVAFIRGRQHFVGIGDPPDPARLHTQRVASIPLETFIYLAILSCVALVWILVQRFEMVGWLLGAASLGAVAYLVNYLLRHCDAEQRRKLFFVSVLVAMAMVWTALAEQTGSLLLLFSERNTSLSLLGFSVTPAQTTAFYMGFLLLFVPLLAALWARLQRAGKDLGAIHKIALAFALQGACYLIIAASGPLASESSRIPFAVVVLALLLHAISELCIYPVGLSQMTRLAPIKIVSTIVAIWFLAISWGQWIGGVIAQHAAVETIGGQTLDAGASLLGYLRIFGAIGVSAAAMVLLLLTGMHAWRRFAPAGIADNVRGDANGGRTL